MVLFLLAGIPQIELFAFSSCFEKATPKTYYKTIKFLQYDKVCAL